MNNRSMNDKSIKRHIASLIDKCWNDTEALLLGSKPLEAEVIENLSSLKINFLDLTNKEKDKIVEALLHLKTQAIECNHDINTNINKYVLFFDQDRRKKVLNKSSVKTKKSLVDKHVRLLEKHRERYLKARRFIKEYELLQKALMRMKK